jgi:hypothetical protein
MEEPLRVRFGGAVWERAMKIELPESWGTC